MRFCLPASLGMLVPSLAMSKRSPPWWGSVDAMLCVSRVGSKESWLVACR